MFQLTIYIMAQRNKRSLHLLDKINRIFYNQDTQISIKDIIPLIGDLSRTLKEDLNYIDWWYKIGSDKYEITIEMIPSYSNRRLYLAKVFCQPSHLISQQDLWPRYYFSLRSCLQECNEWLKRRESNTKKQYRDPYEDY